MKAQIAGWRGDLAGWFVYGNTCEQQATTHSKRFHGWSGWLLEQGALQLPELPQLGSRLTGISIHDVQLAYINPPSA